VLLPAKVPELTLDIYERNSDIVSFLCRVIVFLYIKLLTGSGWRMAFQHISWCAVRCPFPGGLPDIRGLEKFKGNVIHTGAWDPTFDPAAKRLALIGNGASGLQILPELQKVAAHVDHYTRNPTWVAGTLGGETLSREVPISEELKMIWANDSVEYLKYRKGLESQAWTRFAIVHNGGKTNAAAREEFTKFMKTRLGEKKDSLLPLVLPEFSPLMVDNVKDKRPPQKAAAAMTPPAGSITTQSYCRTPYRWLIL
jgi:hypothetical protein